MNMFNPIFIHLITNHFPIFGFLFGAVFLFYGLRKDDRDIRKFSLFILILSTILTAVAYFSGHNSEEIIEKISGISHEALETHESIALIPFSLAIIVGILSILAFLQIRQGYILDNLSPFPPYFSYRSCNLLFRRRDKAPRGTKVKS
jgi:uncharacterized membrane protein